MKKRYHGAMSVYNAHEDDEYKLPEYTWLIRHRLTDPNRGEYIFLIYFDRMSNSGRPFYYLINFSKKDGTGLLNSEVGHRMSEFKLYRPTEKDQQEAVRVICTGFFWKLLWKLQ
jgi:hypothetical protein